MTHQKPKIKFYKISELREIAPAPVPKSSQGLRVFVMKNKEDLQPLIMGHGKGKRYFVREDRWNKLMKKMFGEMEE